MSSRWSQWVVVVLTMSLAWACTEDDLAAAGVTADVSGGDSVADGPPDAPDSGPAAPDVADADDVSPDGEPDTGPPVPDVTPPDVTPPDVADPADVTDPPDEGPADVGPDAGPADIGAPDDAPDAADAADTGPLVPPTLEQCFGGQWGPGGAPVDYAQYEAVLGSHCKGTNHQDITGVERVVFVGDSLTVGSPPTAQWDFYRNVLANALAERFGLTPPDFLWTGYNAVNGVAYAQESESGEFACCAKWGARADDILKPPHQQLPTCVGSKDDKRTLVVLTVGGNDIFAWAQDMVEGAPIEELWVKAQKAVTDLEDAVNWIVDPVRFPNGVFLVFANTFEFTDVDSGNDFATCPGANIISMDTALVDPEFSAMVSWMMSEYLRIAVATGTDMVFMGEHTCGHGHMYDNPEGRCYRGPGAELWLDVTCMHPGKPGHAGIADLFLQTIEE